MRSAIILDKITGKSTPPHTDRDTRTVPGPHGPFSPGLFFTLRGDNGEVNFPLFGVDPQQSRHSRDHPDDTVFRSIADVRADTSSRRTDSKSLPDRGRGQALPQEIGNSMKMPNRITPGDNTMGIVATSLHVLDCITFNEARSASMAVRHSRRVFCDLGKRCSSSCTPFQRRRLGVLLQQAMSRRSGYLRIGDVKWE